jgi:hypothetical protein
MYDGQSLLMDLVLERKLGQRLLGWLFLNLAASVRPIRIASRILVGHAGFFADLDGDRAPWMGRAASHGFTCIAATRRSRQKTVVRYFTCPPFVPG